MITGLATLERRTAALQREIRRIALDEGQHELPRRSATALAAAMGLSLDAWQRDALETTRHHVLLLVSRQGGKGVIGSLLALEQLLGVPGSKTLVVSRTEDQAKRLLARIKGGFHSLPDTPRVITDRVDEFGLITGSRALAVPGSEQSLRGIDAVDLLILDEASLVPDDLYAAVRPMLATTDGRQVALSTPRGKRGWFYRAYESDSPEWYRIKVTADQIPRIKPSFLERERSDLGEFIFAQEYLCEFMDDETQLYPTDLVMAAMSSDLSSFGLPILGFAT